MANKRMAALTAVGAMAIAFGGLATVAQAGSTTYAVEVAANGGVGGCQSSTGTMSNVTSNNTASPITIQCPTPNGFAWGRNLDTPDEAVDAALVDDGSDVAASWKQTGLNNSKGRKLGLLMRVGDMSVKGTALEFSDELDGAFDSTFDTLPNGKISKRANLKLRLPRGVDLLGGNARCADKAGGETAGITWSAGDSVKGKAFRAWKPSILVDCGSLTGGTTFASATNSDFASTAPKFMSATATCSGSQKAVAGGFDVAGSTTSQWPTVVSSGPTASGTGWKVTVAVPSQNSSTAKAIMNVWATCN